MGSQRRFWLWLSSLCYLLFLFVTGSFPSFSSQLRYFLIEAPPFQKPSPKLLVTSESWLFVYLRKKEILKIGLFLPYHCIPTACVVQMRPVVTFCIGINKWCWSQTLFEEFYELWDLYAFYFYSFFLCILVWYWCSCFNFFFPHSMLWKATIVLSRGASVQYRYFKGCFLEPKVCFRHLVSSFLSQLLSKATNLCLETLKAKLSLFWSNKEIRTLD